jgi:pimeloyl-ACP methyl ester carboxylesterase
MALAAAWLASASVAMGTPLEAYGKLPSIEAAAMSPDGERFAVITTTGEARQIVVKELATGVSDLQRMVAWSKTNKGRTAQKYWIRFMGADDPNDPVLRELSPAAKADGVTTPILLVHGRDDTVVPMEQSAIMERALKKAGNPAEMVVMSGEDHWLSRGETRLRKLNAVAIFLEKNNPPS